MANRRLLRCQRGSPRNMGPAVTAGPVPLPTPQYSMHRPGVKSVQANTYQCQATNRPYAIGCPSDNFCNQGDMRPPPAPRLMTNLSETTEESKEAAPILCQAIALVISHQDAPAFLPIVLPRGDEQPA